MIQRIIFKTGMLPLGDKNIKEFSLLFMFIFLIQISLFSQAKTDVMSKAVQDSSRAITIHQEVNFKINPQKLYQTLLSSKEFSACTKKSFSAFSEKSATIDTTIGGGFSLFDGHIIGRIVDLDPNRRIVEAWRVVDWPEGKYSIVSFELSPQGSGTHLSFDHVGFPEGLKEHLSIGWQQHYWDALNNYFQ